MFHLVRGVKNWTHTPANPYLTPAGKLFPFYKVTVITQIKFVLLICVSIGQALASGFCMCVYESGEWVALCLL